MARVATASWVSGTVAPARLRLYHFAFILLTTLLAMAITWPSVSSETTLYRSSATVIFDAKALPGLTGEGKPTAGLLNSEAEIGELLKANYERLGSRTTSLQWQLVAPGTLSVTGETPNPQEALSLTEVAAEKLSIRLYNQAGDAALHEVLDTYFWQALSHAASESKANTLLAELLRTSAVEGVQAQNGRRSLDQLSVSDQFALTRRLEVLWDLKKLDVRKADLTLRAAKTPTALAVATEQQRGANAAAKAVGAFTNYMYATYQTIFYPLMQNSAYIKQAPLAATVVPSYKWLKLGVAAVVGLLGGLLTVLIDRSVGIVPTLLDLWGYRELVRNLVSRDLKARYKNSLLGYFWSLLNPLLTMMIFWLVFSVLLRNDIPQFPVFLIVALLPWNYAVTSVSGGMRSTLDNAHLIKKVYFPRAILPISVVLSNLVNYLLALPVMLVVMFGVQLVSTGHIQVSWTFLYLPVIIIIQTIFLIGLNLLLATSSVFFRDTTHIVDILIQLWIFITPIFFSLEAVTKGNLLAAKMVRWLNPMASLVDFYRDILYGHAIPGALVPAPPSLPALDGVFRTLVTALIILAIGAYVFQRNSSRFGEEL